MPSNKDRAQVDVFITDENPNSAAVAVFPNNIGDLCVDKTNARLYFAFSLKSTDWGTLGTSLT